MSSRKNSNENVLFAYAGLMAGTALVYAQAVTASLLGTGDRFFRRRRSPGQVVITEMNTGISRKMGTNASGNYVVCRPRTGRLSRNGSNERRALRTAVKKASMCWSTRLYAPI